MKLLLVAATAAEMRPLAQRLQLDPDRLAVGAACEVAHRRGALDLLVTGVGLTATACRVARELAAGRYDAALDLGIAGSFRDELPPGSVVRVTSEQIGDLGVEAPGGFRDAFDLGLVAPGEPPYNRDRRIELNWKPPCAALRALPPVRGVSVNAVSATDAAIARLRAQADPDIETMEGAAFAFACAEAGVPCAQLRAVSNRVGERDRARWAVQPAIDAVTGAAHEIVEELLG